MDDENVVVTGLADDEQPQTPPKKLSGTPNRAAMAAAGRNQYPPEPAATPAPAPLAEVLEERALGDGQMLEEGETPAGLTAIPIGVEDLGDGVEHIGSQELVVEGGPPSEEIIEETSAPTVMEHEVISEGEGVPPGRKHKK